MTMPLSQQIKLPQMICFRVTRNCNAHCRFCLAPPEGDQPDEASLKNRIDWLLAHGVRTIHFCGGEPTIHPALTELLVHVHTSGCKSRLTTNGIVISDSLLDVLRTTATEVKVSLHGNQKHHNSIVGVTSFKHTTRNIKKLVDAGIHTSIQTTVVAEQNWVIDWISQFCLDAGVRRLSFLPFIPRGNGSDCCDEFALTPFQRREVRELVKKKRHKLNGRVEVRWLDFNTQPIHVVEADGRIILEAAMETMDEVLCNIPDLDTTLRY